MEKVVLYYFISSPPSGTENCRAVPWWGPAAAVLTRAERVPWQMEQVYSCTASPKSFGECLVLLYCRERRKTQQTSPAPLVKGIRPPSRAADGPQWGSWGFYSRAARRSRAWAVPHSEGQRCWGGSQPCSPRLLSPGKARAPQSQGGVQGPVRSRGAGRSAPFPERGRLSSGTVTVYVRQ